MSTALREIFASFGVEIDTTKLEEAGEKINGTVGQLRKLGAAVLEAFAVEKIVAFTEAAADQAAAIGHTAEATGLSTDELQAWQLGAKEAGLEGEEFTIALRRLSTAMAGGEDAAGSQGKVFAEWGIKTKDAAGNVRGLRDVLPEIAEHFKNTADGAKKAADAQAIFGRQGSRLIPLLNQGSAGVQKLRARFSDLGGGFSPEFIKNAKENEELSADLGVAWDSLKAKAEGPLLIALNYVVGGLIKFAKWAGKLIEGTNIATAAMVTFGTIAAAQLAKVALANAPLIIEFGLIAAAIGLVVLAVDDLITAWQGGDSVIGRAIDKIWGTGTTEKVRNWAKNAVHAIEDWFSKLDFVGALHAVGGLIKEIMVLFSDGNMPLSEKFQAVLDYIEGAFRDRLKAAFGDITGGMVGDFVQAAAEVTEVFVGMTKTVKDIFTGITDFVGEQLYQLENKTADAQAKDAAANAKAAASGRVPTAADYDPSKKGFFTNLLAHVVGFKPEDAVPRRNPTASGQFAPRAYGPPASAAGQTISQTITNTTNVNVQPGTPGHVANQVGRAAAHGATGAHRKAAAALVQGAGK